MKVYLNYFRFLFLIFVIAGCKKEKTQDNPIIGKWEWVQTIFPYGLIVTSPETAGYSLSLDFASNGIMKEFRNDTLISTSDYYIETTELYGLGLRSSILTSPYSIVNDSLIFNGAYVDGSVISYIRIKE
jgi:hypothetical protein